ncbi:MAG: acyl-CoA thioesterase [Pseudomonadales bacterium]
MASHLEKLLALLKVDRVDKYLFTGRSPKFPPRVFGGQVLAQSLNAAIRTVDDEGRMPHSLHAYFLRPGNPKKQIVYEVDPIRDGRSYTTRRVVAKQEGIAIFSTSVSFHVQEGGFEHQFAMPEVPDPEDLEDDFEYWTRMSEDHPEKFNKPPGQAFYRRPVVRRDFLDPQPQEPLQNYWFRAVQPLGDEPILHQTVLAYISDHTLLGAALLAHPASGHSTELSMASLDHAIWFHQPFRADEWLLYHQDSPSAFGGRGFSRGSFYTRDGRLVASVAQESMLRKRR